jgi:hypothetical protein
MAVLAATGLLALGTAPRAFAESNKNAGDVWTDNVGQPAGPGHEHDPHLTCQDINLWGSGLAAPKGNYTIDGWPPSGSQEQDYASTWSYDQSKGGSQVTSVINVEALIVAAAAHGDAPVNGQGYHFKLQFSQYPQKHKTFWVNCPAPTKGGGGNGGGEGNTGGPTGGEGPTGGGGPTGGEGPTGHEGPTGGGTGPTGSGGPTGHEGPTGGTGPTGSGTRGGEGNTSGNTGGGGNTGGSTVAGTNSGVAGSPSSAPIVDAPKRSVKKIRKAPKSHRKLVHVKRHVKPHGRHVNRARDAAPEFTG